MFSIIMPLYNKAPYVRKAIESVVRQSCRTWDLWVIDDGSMDGSAAEVERFSDERIHLVRQANTGVGAARNRGVALSGDAPYLCFLDADDWWEHTYLEEMAALIGRYPDAGVYGTGYYIVKNGRRRVAPIGVDKGFTEGEIDYCKVYAASLCMPLWTGAVCMPRNIFEEQGGFPEGIRLGEDFILWVHTALKHKVVLLNKPLSNYNQDVDAASRGTHHLHAPEHHMLWNIKDLEPTERCNKDYKQLIDNLRTYNLQNYLIDRRYSEAARLELSKVDWSRQPVKMRRLYGLPVWALRCRHLLMKCGAAAKHALFK